jgi:two-component system, cell cycle response regulator DivK
VNTVLVIDDNAKNRKLARDVLGASGFRTLEAASGAAGIVVAAEHEPDVILLDLRLPDMHGTEVVRRLRDGERTARIPVVAMSAMSLREDGDWLEAAGFAGSIDKPIHVHTFPDQVRRFCTEPGGRTTLGASPC